MSFMRKYLTFLLLCVVTTLAFSACTKEGPMEKAGEKIDNTVEEAGDAVEEATER